MKLGKRIKNVLARAAYRIFAREINEEIEKSQNEVVKANAPIVVSLAGDYAEILTDRNPDNKAQIKALTKDKFNQHIEAGRAILSLPISLIKNQELQEDVQAILEAICKELKGQENEIVN